MGYADRSGYARTDARHPSAFGVCDNCGTWYNRFRLVAQYEWAGDALIDQGFLVCPRCISKPQEQFRTPILPLDPVPIDNPRPEYPTILQGLDGFTQYVGPQGSSIRLPVLTELDPTMPLGSKSAVLASAATGWGLPQPALTDRSGTITLSGVGQMVMSANPSRSYLLIFDPFAGLLAAAQDGVPSLSRPPSSVLSATSPETGTIVIGTGEALLQNSLATPPSTVWLGEVFVLGLVAGAPVFCWEG